MGRIAWGLGVPLCLAGLAAGVPTSLTPEEQQDLLAKHNVYRCMHGLPHLTWDAEVANGAQEWADVSFTARQTHSTEDYRTARCSSRCGENSASGYPSLDVEQAVRNWYWHIPRDPYGVLPEGVYATPYTQLVWKTSAKLGCGKNVTPVSTAALGGQTANHEFVVCWYSPPGNVVGQYSAEVLAPSRRAEACDGTVDDDPQGSAAAATSRAAGLARGLRLGKVVASVASFVVLAQA